MKIKYYSKLSPTSNIAKQIFKLLEKSDDEFVPPLSSRGSTTQSNLGKAEKSSVQAYFDEMITQHFFIALDNKKVIGFMSFKKNHFSKDVDIIKNIYISTIIVDSYYRGKGITKLFYKKCLSKYKTQNILTRTWSQNSSHIYILNGLNFVELKRLPNDRGEGIDTIYYIYSRRKKSIVEIITHHKLWGSVLFLIALFLITLVSFIAMFIVVDDIEFQIWSSIGTSILASWLCLLCDTVIRYRDAIRDEYMDSLKSYGISSMRFEKGVLLESLIPKAKEQIWISGYRLKMTSKLTFLDALESTLVDNDLEVRVLLVPPYFETYKNVYADDDVSEHYHAVFKTLLKYPNDNIIIKFIDKPLFNDTYRVDSRIVTSPYMHCTYADGTKIEAKDFFTIDITDTNSKLYELIEDEYNLLWNDPQAYTLDLDKYLDKENPFDNWLEHLKNCAYLENLESAN